jgi:hypothetical protein
MHTPYGLTATETWEISKLVPKWKEVAELKYLVSFPSTEVEWHNPIMPGGHCVHPWAECLKLRSELRNLLMKPVCHSLSFDWWDGYPILIMPECCDMRSEHVIKLLHNLCVIYRLMNKGRIMSLHVRTMRRTFVKTHDLNRKLFYVSVLLPSSRGVL